MNVCLIAINSTRNIVIFQIDVAASCVIYNIIFCFHLTYLVLTTWPI